MSSQIITEQCQKIHDAVHSGTVDFSAIDAALAELRKLANPPPPPVADASSAEGGNPFKAAVADPNASIE